MRSQKTTLMFTRRLPVPTSNIGTATISGARRGASGGRSRGASMAILMPHSSKKQRRPDTHGHPSAPDSLVVLHGIGPNVQRGTSQQAWLVLVPGTWGSVQLENRHARLYLNP